MYVAIKDFLSLCILARHGGLYLDTSTGIGGETNSLAHLVNFFKHPPADIRVVSLGENRPAKVHFYPFETTACDDTLYATAAPDRQRHTTSAEQLQVDAWALYSPMNSHHVAFRHAAQSYLSRMESFGLGEIGIDSEKKMKCAYGKIQ